MLVQALALVIVIYGFSLFQTTVDNLVAKLNPDSFFDEVAPFQIGFSPFFDYNLVNPPTSMCSLLVSKIRFWSLLGIIVQPSWILYWYRLSRGGFRVVHSCHRDLWNSVALAIMFWNLRFFAYLPAPKKSIEMGAFYLNARGFRTPAGDKDSAGCNLDAPAGSAVAGLVF